MSAIRFNFDRSVPMDEARGTLRLAILAAESLHGADRVKLETRTEMDPASRSCLIGVETEAGRTLAAVFAGFARREFGRRSVETQQIVL